MITELHWLQHTKAISLENDVALRIVTINPQPNRYIFALLGWHLCEFITDGTNEAEDIANAKTLCRLHYQHSFSGGT